MWNPLIIGCMLLSRFPTHPRYTGGGRRHTHLGGVRHHAGRGRRRGRRGRGHHQARTHTHMSNSSSTQHTPGPRPRTPPRTLEHERVRGPRVRKPWCSPWRTGGPAGGDGLGSGGRIKDGRPCLRAAGLGCGRQRSWQRGGVKDGRPCVLSRRRPARPLGEAARGSHVRPTHTQHTHATHTHTHAAHACFRKACLARRHQLLH